jgi:uridine nucleosidase
VPVFPGTAKPFCREAAHAESIHGVSGLDGTTVLPEPVAQPQQHPFGTIAAMYEALAAHPGKAYLVATGPLTNIGLLFAAHPDLAASIAGLSIMGGAVGGFFSNAPMGRVAERPDVEMASNVYEHWPEGLHEAEGMNMEEVVRQVKKLGILKDADRVDDEKVFLLLQQEQKSFGNWSPFAEFNVSYLDPKV